MPSCKIATPFFLNKVNLVSVFQTFDMFVVKMVVKCSYVPKVEVWIKLNTTQQPFMQSLCTISVIW